MKPLRKRQPTLELLREVRKLRVVNPDNGIRFTVSLRDWAQVLWAVRVYPEKPRPSDRDNQFCTAHCLMPRQEIAFWLERLQLE